MADRKKKNRNTFLLLLIAMVLMIIAYIWLINSKKNKENVDQSENTNDSVTLSSLDVKSIDGIFLKNENGEMALKQTKDKKWNNEENSSFPVNQTLASNMAEALKEVKAEQTVVEKADDLSQYGLDQPKLQVTVTLKDGTKTNFLLGNEVPITGGYYGTVNGKGTVYIIPASFYDTFHKNITDMTAVEKIPDIPSNNVTYLKVESKDNPAFEIKYDENNYSDYGGTSKWTILQPYKTPISGDAAEISTLLGNYSGLTFETNVDYKASDLGKYGLDEPYAIISLDYYENESTTDDKTASDKTTSDKTAGDETTSDKTVGDKTTNDKTTSDKTTSDETSSDSTSGTKKYYSLKLLIGSTDESGNYYVKLKDSKAVHTMSKETVEKIIQLDAYNYTNHNINMINLESVDHLDVVIDGTTYTMSVEKTKEKVKGEEIGATKYYFNGKSVDETKFKELYRLIISPVTEHIIPKDYVKPEKDTPVITITYYRTTDTGKKVVVNYYPYDESYYRANVNGVEYFLTDLRKINEIVEAIKKF